MHGIRMICFENHLNKVLTSFSMSLSCPYLKNGILLRCVIFINIRRLLFLKIKLFIILLYTTGREYDDPTWDISREKWGVHHYAPPTFSDDSFFKPLKPYHRGGSWPSPYRLAGPRHNNRAQGRGPYSSDSIGDF